MNSLVLISGPRIKNCRDRRQCLCQSHPLRKAGLIKS